mmetsp:Transcript_32840/g.50176  ORF Transcript_32840/g.50176 Transcript_32840/m.50176 type:complete len:102 (+) Transcript_32840:2473-2778(+)
MLITHSTSGRKLLSNAMHFEHGYQDRLKQKDSHSSMRPSKTDLNQTFDSAEKRASRMVEKTHLPKVQGANTVARRKSRPVDSDEPMQPFIPQHHQPFSDLH